MVIAMLMNVLRLLGLLAMVALRVSWPFLLGLGVMLVLRRRRRRTQGYSAPRQEKEKEPTFRGEVKTVDYREVTEEEPREAPLAARPEAPVPFGYKTAWAAVRCDDPRRVMAALGLEGARESGWREGLALAGRDGQVFVSPCLEGFVLAVGLEETLGRAEDLPRWAAEFGEVQFFATHRVAEYHRWGRYAGGRLIRDYCWCGEEGKVLRDVGLPTPEELALGFDRFPRPGREEEDTPLPDEEAVLAIAAAWGVDPKFRKTAYPPSTGWVCR